MFQNPQLSDNRWASPIKEKDDGTDAHGLVTRRLQYLEFTRSPAVIDEPPRNFADIDGSPQNR